MKKKLFIMTVFILIVLHLSAQDNSTKTFEVTIRQVEGFHLVYYEFKGPYDQSFNDFMALMEYLGANNIEMGPHAVGVFYDDPQVVAPENLRSEIGFMVKGPVATTDNYKYRKVDGFKAASVKYYSMEDIMKAYESLGEYLIQSDVTPLGPSYEIYYGMDPNTVDTEILMPIK